MTYGSSHRMWESNVQTCVNPSDSARLARSMTRAAGGVVCRTIADVHGLSAVSGKPRSIVDLAGSGQRLVTTLPRV